MKTEQPAAMTVNRVSQITGLSVRTLQYYDEIGLLSPACRTDAGYRLYDAEALMRLRQIMLFRELEFSLKDIRKIMNDPHFDGEKALQQQIALLRLRREHLDGLIRFAEGLKQIGGNYMDFSAFDRSKLAAYAAQAKAQWGDTDAYREYAEKTKTQTEDEAMQCAEGMMQLFAEFGAMRGQEPADSAVQAQVKKLQDYICAHFYYCTDEILAGLGKMYAAGGEFTENIDRAGGSGTAEFVSKAIAAYCGE